ncbi:MAG: hypothetical protein HYT79_07745 [Elusimicrobia bacterium]|nr:hypothetical protein [Elusimicrobiota bacterium]
MKFMLALITLLSAEPALGERPKYLKLTTGLMLVRPEPQDHRARGRDYDLINKDEDDDCMTDEGEHAVAAFFRPYFIFDSNENARQDNEPVLLYQVTPYRPVVRREPDYFCREGPRIIQIRYAYLFALDGGYGPASICRDRHLGDNQVVTVYVWSDRRGRRFDLIGVTNGHYRWPQTPAQFHLGHHPVVYLSAGKHHAFFDTSRDESIGPYSDWGCHENVNGEGARVLPPVESDAAPRRWHNVGESYSHDQDYFVNDLNPLGFGGDDAWSEAPFCGGHRWIEGADCDDTSPMKNLWR